MDYKFPGYPGFLKAAGAGHPPAVVARARKHPTIAEISRLLSQAAGSDPAYRPEIVRHAAERLDAFRVALATAEAMYAEVHAALFPPANSNNVGVETNPVPDTNPDSEPARTGRKGRR